MKYLIQITTPSKSTADKIHLMIQASAIYQSREEIISLHPVKEVCDNCYQEKVLK